MKSSLTLTTQEDPSAHRRIAENLRQQIVSGQFAPGTRLPSTLELAATCQTSVFTIHTALKALVREGWIDRRNGAGTFIADPKSRFIAAGIYHESDIGSNRHSAFARNLHFALMDQFQRIGKDAQVFIDSRPEGEQGTVLPALAEAISHRRIQCLIAPTTNTVNSLALGRLALPTAFLFNAASPNRVQFDTGQFFRATAKRLATAGCRTVGLISHVEKSEASGKLFYSLFHQAVQEAGLKTKDPWIRRPVSQVADLESYGYHEFRKLWKSPQKPDGLIVYPDSIARGVVLGVLETGMKSVLGRMKFTFHRNAQISFLCPFPVLWAISDENRMAEGLIDVVFRQFKGKKISPVVIPFILKAAPGWAIR